MKQTNAPFTDLFEQLQIPPGRALLVHACLRGVHRSTGIPYPQLSEQLLTALLNCRPQLLLIPAFTIYSFMAVRIFHLRWARSEVGRFSEEIRRQGYPRTPDPMYSVLDILGTLPDGLDYQKTFGPGSLFGYLRQVNGIIVNVDMNAFYATPIHDIEREHEVAYRHLLTFSGRLQREDEPWQKIDYQAYVRRVRPEWNGSFPPYNHQRRLEYLQSSGVLHEARTEAGHVAWADLDSFGEAIGQALQKDPLFLVDG